MTASTMQTPASYISTSKRTFARAFTITELLVVIGIFVLLIGLAVPGFRSMIASTERSLAENQLRVGISSARDAAIQSPTSDAAAVFFFTPGGKVSIIPCISVGFIDDLLCVNQVPQQNYAAAKASNALLRREVFVPLVTAAPVQLPRGWSVRAYTPPNTLSSTVPQSANGWYDTLSPQTTPAPVDPASVGMWVFPETGFYNAGQNNVGTTGWQRQSFMIRFKAGTGVVDAGNRALALVVDPIAAQLFRQSPPYDQNRLDQSPDLAATVRRALAATSLTVIEEDIRCRIFGDQSIDTVLVRPVTELAIYEERNLAGALAQATDIRGFNRETGTFYTNPDTTGYVPGQFLDPNVFNNGEGIFEATQLSGLWIEGRLRLNNQANGPFIETDARIFTVQQYLGQILELKEELN